MENSAIVVPGRGPARCRVMLVGEAPGEDEAAEGRPFVGRAGREQDAYLAQAGLHKSQIYMTNTVKEYIPGNPDPTPELLSKWRPRLMAEIASVNPEFIITVGRFATRVFLPDADMEMVHGLPHHWDGRTVLPCYHPAFGFYDDDARPIIYHDYKRAGDIIAHRVSTTPPTDEYPQVDYLDVYDIIISGWDFDVAAIDTEGVPGDEWSLQLSTAPGSAFVFRKSSPHFAANMASLQRYLDAHPDVVIVVHNGMYDIEMCRLMGLDLFNTNIFDTQYAAYILRVEPQGLKPLAYRWAGMTMASYTETVGAAGLEKQLEYLGTVLSITDWPQPLPRVKLGNDGTARLYTPQPIERRAAAILNDYWSKVKVCDPYERWKQVDRDLRSEVERRLGPMPIGTLADIPLADAVYYAGRDPDATLRIYYRMVDALRRQNLTTLMSQGCEVIPVFEEMQSSGLLASRRYFTALSERMSDAMGVIQSRISHRYCGGRPFNPNSPPQVATLMRRRGLVGEKRLKTGKISTGKKSIEHLRHTDSAIADVIDWREHAKIRDSFAEPILECLGDADTRRVRGNIKITRVASRRISMSDPNLTAIPVRNELGLLVRDGFVAEEGCSLGSWDLSQIEMRYMAHLSRDPQLVKFFKENRDVHAETASRIFGIPLADVQEMAHRYPSKRAGFGIITNIQGAGLLDQLRMFGCTGWDEDSCNRLIREWLKVYKGVADFLASAKREVYQNGYVRDAWGHIRYLPGIWSEDRKVAAEASRAASSHKIQAGAQGMLQRSMAWLKPRIRELQSYGLTCRWLLQIHDELVFEFQDDLWDVIDPLVIEALTEHSMTLIVPVKAKGSRAKSWGRLKA